MPDKDYHGQSGLVKGNLNASLTRQTGLFWQIEDIPEAIIGKMIERPPIHLMIAGLVLILVVAALGISPQPERLNRSLSLASNYYQEGLYQQALVHYRAALAWQPYRVDIHERLASSAIQVEDLDLALTELQPQAEANRLSPEGWLLLGDLHLRLKHPELALQAYEKIEPDTPAAVCIQPQPSASLC